MLGVPRPSPYCTNEIVDRPVTHDGKRLATMM
jgi:hypothetical protein